MKIDYGIDAPGVIAGLGLGGLALIALSAVDCRLSTTFRWWGACWMATAMLMLVYAKVGKFRHRERILDLARLSGDETVLDVGTGRGLLAIGAAKRLSGGKAVGIDIFQKSDLSGNALPRTLENVALEGVGARCEIRHEDARALQFADGSVDVVVSNLCLHNIHPRQERDRALAEIARVLKPGGRAVISDFIATWQYSAFFRARGFSVTGRTFAIDTFPPLRIVVAEKPVGA